MQRFSIATVRCIASTTPRQRRSGLRELREDEYERHADLVGDALLSSDVLPPTGASDSELLWQMKRLAE